MLCATCGSTLSAAGAACTVCDPWATPGLPASQTTHAAQSAHAVAVGLPQATQIPAAPAVQTPAVTLPQGTQIPHDPATYMGSSLPRWYRLLIRRNPPVRDADLDAAWRNTVVAFSVNAAALAAMMAATTAAAISNTSGGYETAVFVILAGTVLAVVVGFALRRKTWLGQVVALLGARPHLGYASLLGIPAIARLNTAYTVGQRGLYAACVVFVLGRQVGPMLLWVPFAAGFLLIVVQFALQSAARKPAALLLGSWTVQPPA